MPSKVGAVSAEDLIHVFSQFKSLALESIYLGRARLDDLPLVKHHAQREGPEKDGLHEQHDDPEQATWVVLACVVALLRHTAGQKLCDDQDQRVEAHEKDVGDEEDEELVVPHANAVVDPRAVVIHFHDAPPADAAVMGPLRLEVPGAPLASLDEARVLAVRASLRVRRLRDGHRVLRHRPGVREHRAHVTGERQEGDDMEEHNVRNAGRRPLHPRVDDVRGEDPPRKKHQHPRDHGADHAAGLHIEPHAGRVVGAELRQGSPEHHRHEKHP
mmetsp:Transcript_6307/g.24568  ORF Transcript_6307/g.24568 Transcript_6307/m.24568 type:complete len:272 (-) Transcript_6307:512-1327(-)